MIYLEIAYFLLKNYNFNCIRKKSLFDIIYTVTNFDPRMHLSFTVSVILKGRNKYETYISNIHKLKFTGFGRVLNDTTKLVLMLF